MKKSIVIIVLVIGVLVAIMWLGKSKGKNAVVTSETDSSVNASVGEIAGDDTTLQRKKKMSDVHHLISPKEFKQKMESGEYVLVDIRTPEEYEAERLPGVDLNLDFYADDFANQVNKLDKNKKYLYYCRTGHRSGQAGHYAEDLGFKEVYELDGGIVAWKKAGFNTVKGE